MADHSSYVDITEELRNPKMGYSQRSRKIGGVPLHLLFQEGRLITRLRRVQVFWTAVGSRAGLGKSSIFVMNSGKILIDAAPA